MINENIRLSNLQINRNSRDYLVMRYLLRDLKKNIQDFAFGNVLDIGCGNKPYEVLFKDRITSYTGCDVAQSDKNKVDIICSATDLSFEENKFDIVFSTQVIEHVNDPSLMIKEAYRVLRLNGVAIFSVPFCWQLHEEPHDYFRFTKYGLKVLFEKEGFQVLHIQANGGKWAATFQMNLNTIYSIFNKNSFFRRILKFIFINLRVTYLLNIIAIWIDKKYYDELLTLNYVIVAKRIS